MLENIAEIIAAGGKAATRHLEEIEARLRAGGTRTQSVQVTGAPVFHFLAQARQHRADYIVMRSRGHTAVYDLLVGSTTHRVPC